MMTERFPVLDFRTPAIARVYDYWLGGKDNFAADRELGDRIADMMPSIVDGVVQNRAWILRVVRLLAGEYGIDQFLDIGCGLPAPDNVHHVAQRVRPRATVVYVDNDPVVLSYGQALLAGSGSTGVIDADVRDPGGILGHTAMAVIDFGRPVAVILAALLHFLDDAEADRALGGLVGALAPGSFVAISHPLHTNDVGKAAVEYQRLGPPVVPRSIEQIGHFFTGLSLLEPGLVPLAEWRPDIPVDNPVDWAIGGVGRLGAAT